MSARKITVAQAADELGISSARVRQLIATGRIRGVERIGPIYVIVSPIRVVPPLDDKHRTPEDKRRLRKSAGKVST